MKKRIISFITALTMFLSLVYCVGADDIDYSCYKGEWETKDKKNIGVNIKECTDNTMDFYFYAQQFGIEIKNAKIRGTTVYGEYDEVWDDGIDFINFHVYGYVTLELGKTSIEVEWEPYENGEAGYVMDWTLYNDNFVYKTKNTSSNNSSSSTSSSSGSSSSTSSSSGSSSSNTSQSGSKGTITVTKDLDIKIDGKSVYFYSAKPFIDSAGRTQVPVRFVAEQLGYEVEWESPNNIDNIPQGGVTIRGDNIPVEWDGETVYRSLFLAIGSSWIGIFDFETSGGSGYGRSRDIYMDTEAMIKNARTYIPLRYVAVLLGYNVVWQ